MGSLHCSQVPRSTWLSCTHGSSLRFVGGPDLMQHTPRVHLSGSGPDGAEEIKRHPFYSTIDWNVSIRNIRANFYPAQPQHCISADCGNSAAVMLDQLWESYQSWFPSPPIMLPETKILFVM